MWLLILCLFGMDFLSCAYWFDYTTHVVFKNNWYRCIVILRSNSWIKKIVDLCFKTQICMMWKWIMGSRLVHVSRPASPDTIPKLLRNSGGPIWSINLTNFIQVVNTRDNNKVNPLPLTQISDQRSYLSPQSIQKPKTYYLVQSTTSPFL